MSVVTLFKLTMLICIHLTIATDCPNPKSPSNGYVYVSSVKAGSTAVYRCKPNHKLIGENINICGRNGEWEKPIPVCFSEKQLSCKTTADEVLNVRSETAVRVNCPGNCLHSEAPVYGTMIYKTSSSICRAAVHGGVIGKDINHCISAVIRNNGQYANFRSSEKNGIVSRRDVIRSESFVFVTNGNQSRRDPSGCGISSAPSPSFIVNGNASGIDEWPWQAVIARSRRQKQIFSPICGGSLLNEDWVLTAAQCVTFPGRKDVLPISMSRIYLGKYYRDDEKDDKYVQVAEVGEIHVHTDYEPKTYDADIAMIKLKKPIKFTKRVRPVCLPTFQSTSENLVENKFGVVTGWGRADLQFASTLKQTRIPVVSSSVCAEGYKSAGITITDNMFCADVCIGNSGSPMVFQQSSTKKWTIEGILNWGSPYGCGKLKNQYTVFVRIQRFVDWINEFM